MLTAFTAGLILITISELGDKTFFITAILAMRYPRRWVFAGSVAALAAMTVLSVLLGQVATLLPSAYVRWSEILLFLGFGLKLLYDASRMSNQGLDDDCKEAAIAVDQAVKPGWQAKLGGQNGLAVMTKAFGLTFVAEWGDRTQITTIALAAANHPLGVTLGAVVGHASCALIAVVCGRLICRWFTERTLTAIGGGLFLLFALVGWLRLLGVLQTV